MNKSDLALKTFGGGSLPHDAPELACRLSLEAFDLPTWPQLPNRTFLENMYVQYSERFPGVVVTDERIYVDRQRDLDAQLEQLYIAYLANDVEYGKISPDYAAGLYRLLDMGIGKAPAVKGQVTGPVSWGLTVVDENRRPVLYDDVLAEAVAKHLRLKGSWVERQLKKLSPNTLVLVDEPYMSSFGSAYISLSQEQAVSLIGEVLAGIEGLKGLHCCGNTDWPLMMSTGIDILSFDAYEYSESLALYPGEVQAFIDRGGLLAWGIIPASDRVLAETADTLVEGFLRCLGLLEEKGLHRDDLLAAAMITPSCGCGSLKVETAERVLKLTREVGTALQTRFA